MLSICIEKQIGRKLSIISGTEDVIYLVETSRELLGTYKIRLPIPPPALYYIESSSTNIGGFSIHRSFVSPLISPKILVIRMIPQNLSNSSIFHSKISILLSLLTCILLESQSMQQLCKKTYLSYRFLLKIVPLLIFHIKKIKNQSNIVGTMSQI